MNATHSRSHSAWGNSCTRPGAASLRRSEGGAGGRGTRRASIICGVDGPLSCDSGYCPCGCLIILDSRVCHVIGIRGKLRHSGCVWYRATITRVHRIHVCHERRRITACRSRWCIWTDMAWAERHRLWSNGGEWRLFIATDLVEFASHLSRTSTMPEESDKDYDEERCSTDGTSNNSRKLNVVRRWWCSGCIRNCC